MQLNQNFATPKLKATNIPIDNLRCAPVLSFQMLKGGVAKTTAALQVIGSCHRQGLNVLALDLDQQANLSLALGVDAPECPTWVDIVEGKIDFESCLVPISKRMTLVPSNLNNSVLDRVLLSSTKNISQAVAQHLREKTYSYDLVVIDTAPSLSAINTAVACASNLIILPVCPDQFSFYGLRKSLEELSGIKREFFAEFETKILFNRFDARESLSKYYLQFCHDQYGSKMLDTFIRSSSQLKRSIFDKITQDPSGLKINKNIKLKVHPDYMQLTVELLSFLKVTQHFQQASSPAMTPESHGLGELNA